MSAVRGFEQCLPESGDPARVRVYEMDGSKLAADSLQRWRFPRYVGFNDLVHPVLSGIGGFQKGSIFAHGHCCTLIDDEDIVQYISLGQRILPDPGFLRENRLYGKERGKKDRDK